MSSENIHLQRISISNFRAYPEDFVLTLPSGPGVTILSGPNGLGKTSLFEAVEWAMTGNVRRLSSIAKNKLDGKYLLRRESGSACEVSLVFSDDLHIRRLQTVGVATTTVGNDVHEIAAAIRAPDARWNVTGENLANYLQLTHLHAQTAEMRLVSWEPDTRWLRVSPLAGADRFDRLRANLRNARTGLTRIIRAREQASALALQASASWQSRLEEFRTSTLLDRAAHDALSPSDALAAMAPVLDELRLAGGDGSTATTSSVAVLVTETRTRVEREIESVRETEARLRALQDLPSQWARASVLLESTATRQKRLQASLLETNGRLRTAQQSMEQRTSTRTVSELELRSAEQRHRAASTMRLDAESQNRIPSQLAALVPLFVAHEASIRSKEGALQSAISTRDQLLRDSQLRDTIAQSISSIRAAVGRLDEASEVDRQLERESRRIDGLRAQVASLRGTSAAFEAELLSAKDQRARAVAGIEREGSRLGEMARAVIAIATHLTEHDDTCPVCKSEFPPKVLRERALADTDTSSAALTALRGELDAAERNVVYLESKGRELQGQIRSVEQEVSSLLSVDAQLRARASSLRSDPLLVPLEGAVQRLRDQMASRQSELEILSTSIQDAPTHDSLVERIAQTRAALDEVSRESERTRAQYERLVAEQSALTAKVDSARVQLGLLNSKRDLAAVVSELAKELAEAQQRNVSAMEAATAAKAANDVAFQEREAASDLEAACSTEVIRTEEALSSIRSRWRQGRLDGDPSDTSLQASSAAVTAREEKLTGMVAVLGKVAAGLEEWERRESIRRQESLLVAEAGAASLEEHGLALASATLETDRSLQAAQSAYDASDRLTSTVREIGESFGSEAIAPFSEVFRGFLRALVRDTRYHDVRPEFARTRGGGNILRFNLGLGGDALSRGADFQVELVLSEGQLSEVSLAAMLAAGCTYPWSRWRALLLDDPTQYQDLTHTTSLFEVIRNLATNGGFQVVMAIHDRAQADFLLRKLASARVPHVECEYVALGPQGAVTQVRRFHA